VEKYKMTVISHRFETSASPEKLWRCLSDLTMVQNYNPTILNAKLSGNMPAGLGTLRECELKPKGRVLERVSVWEAGKAIGLEVVESDWPITKMSWVTRITPKDGGSVLSQNLEYGMKFGPVGWLLNALVMKRNIKKNVGEALSGLIQIAEREK
jgi:Polyketide cyclase / dehydrase and lipid transport